MGIFDRLGFGKAPHLIEEKAEMNIVKEVNAIYRFQKQEDVLIRNLRTYIRRSELFSIDPEIIEMHESRSISIKRKHLIKISTLNLHNNSAANFPHIRKILQQLTNNYYHQEKIAILFKKNQLNFPHP